MDAVEGMANTVSNNKRDDGAAGGKEDLSILLLTTNLFWLHQLRWGLIRHRLECRNRIAVIGFGRYAVY